MRFAITRCKFCGNPARKRCTYCNESICARCQVVHKRKIYCSIDHRDRDAGIGHFLRNIMQPLRMT